ncbi:tetratricopeptide repeat protein [Chryseobacterium sp. c4a]|uniref:tetratricopeptide repeat protein n=1 Tax=Chryseobacterium sp. c4a TaxID=1573582 RepID=UPI001358A2A8|nr:tetratricopeptide repeat protein [Chryseobacterium sp. c4a]
MNPRVLELIKNPKNIQSEDLGLLKEEIHAFPYIQNIRALHLYGVHLYEKENYQKELSVTAAYTTDKKILYQLINGKIQQEVKPEVIEDKPSVIAAEKPVRYNYNVKGFPIKRDETSPASEKTETEEKEACIVDTAQEVKHLYVNGERNRILFEGEENFLDETNSETIDLESTIESGTLVTQKNEPEGIEHVQQESDEAQQQEIEENAGEDFTPEVVISEEQVASEEVEETVGEAEHLSFEETESILPETNIEENIGEEPTEDAEAIANEEIPVSEIEEEIAAEPDAELSFHGTDAFLPDVKIQANTEEVTEIVDIPTLNVNKHEEEMRRLIEEVEKKMKETKSAPQEEQKEPEPAEDHEISFAETQSFHFWSTDQENSNQQEETKEKDEEVQDEVAEHTEPEIEASAEKVVEESVPEVQTAWKPMSLESNMPDSLIKKPVETVVSVSNTPIKEEVPSVETIESVNEPEAIEEAPVVEDVQVSSEEQSENAEKIQETLEAGQKEEVPVMNVSFFGTDISSLKVGESKKEDKEEPVKEEPMKEAVVESTPQSSIDSNVPGFINTWQSWLKIGRTDEVEKEKEEIKEKAIETFIENNPRISQLKEESTYVVKEKNDDISHLMTETLANLYFEQKLYSKAIKAFEILIKKHPEKKDYFQTRIKEIKDFRSKN